MGGGGKDSKHIGKQSYDFTVFFQVSNFLQGRIHAMSSPLRTISVASFPTSPNTLPLIPATYNSVILCLHYVLLRCFTVLFTWLSPSGPQFRHHLLWEGSSQLVPQSLPLIYVILLCTNIKYNDFYLVFTVINYCLCDSLSLDCAP